MKNYILILLVLFKTLTAEGQKKMENKFITWNNFVDGFGKEMVSAEDVFKNMVKKWFERPLLDQNGFHFYFR